MRKRTILYVIVAVVLFLGEVRCLPTSIVLASNGEECETEYEVIRLVGEELDEYLRMKGEQREPDLVEICIRIPKNDGIAVVDENSDFWEAFQEYYVTDVSKSIVEDMSTIIAQYIRPAGEIVLDESVNVSLIKESSANVSLDVLSFCLGESFQSSYMRDIKWTGEYSYEVKIKVYPIYEVTRGNLWEEDVFVDDDLGAFTVKKPVGDIVKAYRNGSYIQ